MSAASTQDLTSAAIHTNDAEPTPRFSPLRCYTLLSLFCLAQFIDAFNLSALFSAIPSIKRDLLMTDIQAVWLISAFALTFASFLLLSGRISDIYNPSEQCDILVDGSFTDVCFRTRVRRRIDRARRSGLRRRISPSDGAFASHTSTHGLQYVI